MNWNVGIDLGAWGVRMTIKGKGLVLRTSGACAMKGEKLLAIGDDAYHMLGRAASCVEILYPMKNGAIGSERALSAWLKYLIQNAMQILSTRNIRLLIARPPQMGLSQMRRLTALALEAGASACGLVASDLAAALGVGIALEDRKTHMVVQVGGGMVSATLEAGLRVIACEALPYGLNRVDEAIQRMLRLEQGLIVGPVTAQLVKTSLAEFAADGKMKEQIVGLSVESGFPVRGEADVASVVQCIRPITDTIPELVCRVLDEASVEMTADLMEEGILLTGGGARIYGLDKQISEASGLSCRIVEDSSACVAKGLDVLLEASDDYQYLVQAHQTLLERRLSLGVRV